MKTIREAAIKRVLAASTLVLASAVAVVWPARHALAFGIGLHKMPAAQAAPAERDALPDRSIRPAYVKVFPVDSEPFGLSYGEWLAKGLQMTWSVPQLYISATEPATPTDTNNCGIGQSEPVWFLGISGTVAGGTHKCLVPQGVAVMAGFAFVNTSVPNLCGQVGSLSWRELQAAIDGSLDTATNVSITIDGATVQNVANRFRVQAPSFWLALAKDQFGNDSCPPDDQIPAGIYSPTAGGGFVVLLKPLEIGAHVIRVHVEFPGFRNFDDTYQVTVVPVHKR